MEMILTGALSFDILSHDHKSKGCDKEYTKKYNYLSVLYIQIQITLELLLLRHNSFPGSKFKLIMEESQKLQKLQSSMLVFLSNQQRKEKILDASKELSQSREDH